MGIKQYVRNGLQRRADELRDQTTLKAHIFDIWFTLIIGVVFVLGASAVSWLSGGGFRGSPGKTVQQRAEQLSKSLSEATHLIDQMKSEIDGRQAIQNCLPAY